MTRESAILGTPSIRYNSFVGRLSCFEELEDKFGLTFGFRPGDEPKMLDMIRDLLSRGDLAEEWQEKRKRLLAEKPNFLRWITDTFDSKI
jgi:predicted glycosyltransferase